MLPNNNNNNHDGAHNNHRESLGLPLLMGSSCIPLQLGRAVNQWVFNSGWQAPHSLLLRFRGSHLLPAPAPELLSAGLAAASVPLCSSQRCTETPLKSWQESSKRFQQQRRSPARLEEQRAEGKGITGLFNPWFSWLYKGQQEACGAKGKSFVSKSGAILSVSLSLLSERSNFCFLGGSKGVCQGWQKKGRS